MLEILTGTGLAAAAGLNAYIPLLALGLASRFLDFVQLPSGWAWLSNPWVLVILGVLLVIEIIADKIPVVDSINDWLQTIIRPVAGGIVFGGGSASKTALVTDPAAFFASNQWVPIVVGIVIALLVHVTKSAARPVINTMTAGLAAPAVSAAEDAGSVTLSLSAILIPILVLVILALVIYLFVRLFRSPKRKQAATELTP
jgi:large-conductance mechanosensitive channel